MEFTGEEAKDKILPGGGLVVIGSRGRRGSINKSKTNS